MKVDLRSRRARTLKARGARILVTCLLALGLSNLAFGAPLTFSVTGTGSFSQPVSGLTDSPFWWIDTTGGVSGAPVNQCGFDIFVGPGVTGISPFMTGSFLTSTPFTLVDGETLTVAMTLLSLFPENFDALGFGLLLENSTVQAVLANSRPDGITHFGDLPHPQEVDFTPPGPGVTYSGQSKSISSPFTLGAFEYGQQFLPDGTPSVFSCHSHICETDIVSSVTPGAGTYQLLFGSYGQTSALAVTAVTTSVPEPGTLSLLGVPVLLQIWRRRRQRTPGRR
jgi:hypothetical protein